MEVMAPHIRLLLQARPRPEDRSSGYRGVRFAALGAANLLLCSYYERFLQNETGLSALLTLLFVESVFLAVWIIRYFLSGIAPVLYRASLFGTSSPSRFWFTLLAATSHPLSLVLWGTTVIAIAVLSAHTPGGVLFAIAITLALGLNVVTSILAVLVMTNRKPDAVGLLLLIGSGLIALAAMASLLTWSSGILATILPLAWSAEGLRGVRNGDWGRAALSLVLLSLLPAAAILIGRRNG